MRYSAALEVRSEAVYAAAGTAKFTECVRKALETVERITANTGDFAATLRAAKRFPDLFDITGWWLRYADKTGCEADKVEALEHVKSELKSAAYNLSKGADGVLDPDNAAILSFCGRFL